jgi:hypothetical protein
MAAIEPSAVDAAWVSVETPLSAARLAEFCRDVERLYRINPYLEFRRWAREGTAGFDASWRNLSNQRDLDLRLTLEHGSDREFAVRYDRGLKTSTRFSIEDTPRGSRLVITDDYNGAERSGAIDISEVDKSLHAWGVALHEYLRREARWGRYALWRWYMRRVWLPMKPAARRITFVILVVTLGEIALIALVMAIYWVEYLR